MKSQQKKGWKFENFPDSKRVNIALSIMIKSLARAIKQARLKIAVTILRKIDYEFDCHWNENDHFLL